MSDFWLVIFSALMGVVGYQTAKSMRLHAPSAVYWLTGFLALIVLVAGYFRYG